MTYARGWLRGGMAEPRRRGGCVPGLVAEEEKATRRRNKVCARGEILLRLLEMGRVRQQGRKGKKRLGFGVRF